MEPSPQNTPPSEINEYIDADDSHSMDDYAWALTWSVIDEVRMRPPMLPPLVSTLSRELRMEETYRKCNATKRNCWNSELRGGPDWGG